jgi:hypothetical protein
MRPNIRLYASRILLASLACALVLSLAGGLTACKTVDLGDDAAQDSVAEDTATAILRITNNIRLFSDSLDFYLFSATTEFSTAAGGRLIGGVGIGKTGVFKVPAGTWKLAFVDQAKVMTAMRSLDTDDWVKSILAKDADYSLILSSDGQDIRWDPTFPTDPSLK